RQSAVGAARADVGERRVRVPFDRQITDGHHADGVAVVEHRHASDRVFTHQLDGLEHVGVRVDRDELVARDLVDGGRVGVAVEGHASHHDVAVGDHPADAVAIHHEHVADVGLAHAPGGLGNGRGLGQPYGLCAHHITYVLGHDMPP